MCVGFQSTFCTGELLCDMLDRDCLHSAAYVCELSSLFFFLLCVEVLRFAFRAPLAENFLFYPSIGNKNNSAFFRRAYVYTVVGLS